ncbi:MAG TPA: hypothetical protein VLM40_09750, partial [Gemmata sp.]|nr:hypothetical protein [Gemmata sp.]
MTPLLCRSIGAGLLAVLMIGLPARSQPILPPPQKAQPELAPAPVEQPEPGMKVLDKGPVHEAFAQPGAETRGKGVTAPKAPPPPIPEIPPETKPEGANVTWVPGYWSWDKDLKDFIWVSGFYRNAPEGRVWQAGEWTKSAGGTYAYSPGFWRPSNMNSWRVDLPEPPKSVENGPSTPSSSPDGIWVPGQWEYMNGQYAWRPGYWAYPNGNQVWQPGQYLANGSGYSYCPGYWDYPLEYRGYLNAPVYFSQPLWLNNGWAYRPRFGIGLGLGSGWGYGGLFDSMYIDPGYNSYYYGNYGYPYGYGYGYGGGLFLGLGSWLWSPFWGFGYPFFGFGYPYYGYGRYGHGYHPWYAYHRGYYNPLWHHYTWLNRNNPQFSRN